MMTMIRARKDLNMLDRLSVEPEECDEAGRLPAAERPNVPTPLGGVNLARYSRGMIQLFGQR